MKKNYIMTPEEYRRKDRKISEISSKLFGHRFGRTKAKIDVPKEKVKLATLEAELAKVDVPDEKFYFKNETVYNLYMNRNNKEPITSDEMVKIVDALLEHMSDIARTHSYTYYSD